MQEPRMIAKPGGVLVPPYLPRSPAHSAGPTQNHRSHFGAAPFATPPNYSLDSNWPPKLLIFTMLANFWPIEKGIQKHISSKPHKISKNVTLGAEGPEFEDVFMLLGPPFSINSRYHLNLLNCKRNQAKISLKKSGPLI